MPPNLCQGTKHIMNQGRGWGKTDTRRGRPGSSLRIRSSLLAQELDSNQATLDGDKLSCPPTHTSLQEEASGGSPQQELNNYGSWIG